MYVDNNGKEYFMRYIARDFETGEEFVIFTPADYDIFDYGNYVLKRDRFNELMTECKTQRASYRF